MTWGNDIDAVAFRRRERGTPPASDEESGAWARLWIGLGALLVMGLAHPFYEYAVASRLAERDAQRALSQMQRELEAVGQSTVREAATQQVVQRQATREQRLAAVRVMGVSDSGGVPTVMADLQGLTAAQALAPLCAQSRAWLRRPVAGEVLRIRAARGSRPAEDVGSIRCP